MTILKQAVNDNQAEVHHLNENHARYREKILLQYDLVASDHHREVMTSQEQAKGAERATINITDRLETVFSRSTCTSLDQLVGAHSAAFDQFPEGSFQNVLRDL